MRIRVRTRVGRRVRVREGLSVRARVCEPTTVGGGVGQSLWSSRAGWQSASESDLRLAEIEISVPELELITQPTIEETSVAVIWITGYEICSAAIVPYLVTLATIQDIQGIPVFDDCGDVSVEDGNQAPVLPLLAHCIQASVKFGNLSKQHFAFSVFVVYCRYIIVMHILPFAIE